MGMSASQMRYCMLAGRKSDVEFQGQQINQQRTTLATVSSEYNSDLLNLTVPTPPSSTDYTKSTYSFTMNGVTNCTIATNGLQYNESDSTYNVTYNYKTTADQATTGEAQMYKLSNGTYAKGVSASTASKLTKVSDVISGVAAADEASTVYKDNNAKTYSDDDVTTMKNALKSIISTQSFVGGTVTGAAGVTYSPLAKVSSPDANTQTAIKNSTGSYSSDETYYTTTETDGGNTKIYYIAASDLTTNGSGNYSVTAHQQKANATDADITKSLQVAGDAYDVLYSNGDYQFVKQSDLNTITQDNPKNVTYYYIKSGAEVTKSSTFEHANTSWASSGRLQAITVTNASGKTTTYDMTTTTTTDTTAYNDAYNEYEYKKNDYDHQVESINAKLKIIESQDRTLELKLQNLDTQQKALSTEMDSVKKVIEKNVESSFKAFSA